MLPATLMKLNFFLVHFSNILTKVAKKVEWENVSKRRRFIMGQKDLQRNLEELNISKR